MQPRLGWSQTCYIAEYDFELVILLPPPFKCCSYRNAPSFMWCWKLNRASCTLGKHSTNWAIFVVHSPPPLKGRIILQKREEFWVPEGEGGPRMKAKGRGSIKAGSKESKTDQPPGGSWVHWGPAQSGCVLCGRDNGKPEAVGVSMSTRTQTLFSWICAHISTHWFRTKEGVGLHIWADAEGRIHL